MLPFVSSYHLNVKMEEQSTGHCWPGGLAHRLAVREFLSSNPGDAECLKKK